MTLTGEMTAEMVNDGERAKETRAELGGGMVE